MSSYPTRHREFQTNRKKTQKIKKHDYDFIQKPKQVGNGQERGKKKNRSDELLPDPEQRIPKKIKKIKKHLYDFFSSQNRLEMAVNE